MLENFLFFKARLVVGISALTVALTLFTAATPLSAHAQNLPDFTELVERVGPAVVNIRTTEKARAGRAGGIPGMPEMDEDMLEFFRRFGMPFQGSRRIRKTQDGVNPNHSNQTLNLSNEASVQVLF